MNTKFDYPHNENQHNDFMWCDIMVLVPFILKVGDAYHGN